MPGLMMRCPRGHAFESRGIHVTSATNVTATGNTETCPTCGSIASQAVEGRFDVDEHGNWRRLATVLRPPSATLSDYEALRDLLRSLKSAHIDVLEAADQVRESTPIFGGLADWMQSNKGGATAGWLTVLLTLVIWILSQRGTGASPRTTITNDVTVDITVNNPAPPLDEIERQIQRLTSQLRESPGTSPSSTSDTVPRNAPCPCDSGRKYKKCHGAPPNYAPQTISR